MNFLKKTILILSSLTTLLSAEDSAYYASSLIGIEIGASSIKSETYNSSATSYSSTNNKVGNIGLKVGAQTKNYRLFFNLKSYLDNGGIYDYLLTYGIQGDYLFPISSKFNIFIGIEGGLADANFKLANEKFSRTISDTYLGGELGCNATINEKFDIEFGTRVLKLDMKSIKNNTIFNHNRIASLYMSIIYKFKMN